MAVPVNCLNFEARLNRRLDMRMSLSGDKELSDHAAVCTNCKSLFQDYQTISEYPSVGGSPNSMSVRGQPIPFETTFETTYFGSTAVYSLVIALMIGMCLVFGFSHSLLRPTSSVADNSYPATHFNDAIIERRIDGSAVEKKISNPNVTVYGQSLVNWNQISEQLLPLNSYYQISAELPGVRPFQCSLGLTIDWFQQAILSLSNDGMGNPGVGVIVREQHGQSV